MLFFFLKSCNISKMLESKEMRFLLKVVVRSSKLARKFKILLHISFNYRFQ